MGKVVTERLIEDIADSIHKMRQAGYQPRYLAVDPEIHELLRNIAEGWIPIPDSEYVQSKGEYGVPEKEYSLKVFGLEAIECEWVVGWMPLDDRITARAGLGCEGGIMEKRCGTCADQSRGYLEDRCIRDVSVNHKRPPDDFPGCDYYKPMVRPAEFDAIVTSKMLGVGGPVTLMMQIINGYEDVWAAVKDDGGPYRVRLTPIGRK